MKGKRTDKTGGEEEKRETDERGEKRSVVVNLTNSGSCPGCALVSSPKKIRKSSCGAVFIPSEAAALSFLTAAEFWCSRER